MHRKLHRIARKIKEMPSGYRIALGVLLLIGGLLWFLPILGLWMIPLGLMVLSVDFPWARRAYLSLVVWLRKKRRPRKAPPTTP